MMVHTKMNLKCASQKIFINKIFTKLSQNKTVILEKNLIAIEIQLKRGSTDVSNVYTATCPYNYIKTRTTDRQQHHVISKNSEIRNAYIHTHSFVLNFISPLSHSSEYHRLKNGTTHTSLNLPMSILLNETIPRRHNHKPNQCKIIPH